MNDTAATAKQQVFDAPTAADGPIPAYKVVHVKGPFEIPQRIYDHTTKKMTIRNTVIPDGYMVYFPRGHSLFKRSLEDLEASGFGDVVPLIRNMRYDAEANKEVEDPNLTTKRIIEEG